jgi:hypothetical protein
MLKASPRFENQLTRKVFFTGRKCFLSLSLSPYFFVVPTLKHRASMKIFDHISFLILRQCVGLLGREISQSQGRCLHKHRINAYIHAPSWIRTHDPSVRASDSSSYLRPRGYCDRQFSNQYYINTDWLLLPVER